MQSNKKFHSSCLLGCLDENDGDDKKIKDDEKKESCEIINRIKRNSQSNGMYISVELLNEETTETLSPDLKMKYILTKRDVSIESVFNSSQILVTETHLSEKRLSEPDINKPLIQNSDFKLSGIRRIPSRGTIF